MIIVLLQAYNEPNDRDFCDLTTLRIQHSLTDSYISQLFCTKKAIRFQKDWWRLVF